MQLIIKGATIMEIKVQKLGQDELKKREVLAWPIWTKKPVSTSILVDKKRILTAD